MKKLIAWLKSLLPLSPLDKFLRARTYMIENHLGAYHYIAVNQELFGKMLEACREHLGRAGPPIPGTGEDLEEYPNDHKFYFMGVAVITQPEVAWMDYSKYGSTFAIISLVGKPRCITPDSIKPIDL